jgi:hypothetical protein
MTPSEISKKEWLLRNALENLEGDIILLEKRIELGDGYAWSPGDASISDIRGTLKVNMETAKLNLCVATVAQATQFLRLLERAQCMPYSMIPKDL